MPLAPYLLLQSRDPHDPMRAHEVECFRASLGAREGEVRVVDVLDRLPARAEIRGARAFLMGGSGDYSCLDPDAWIGRFVEFVRDEVVPSGVPTFGSCFGLQILTLALGGEMIRDPQHREVGSIDLWVTDAAKDDPLFGSLPRRFVAQAGHNDRASRAPDSVDVLASSDRCPVSAIRVRGRPVWATQFHPELDANAVTLRYLTYMEKYSPPEVAALGKDAPFLKSLRPSESATALLARFATFCELAKRS